MSMAGGGEGKSSVPCPGSCLSLHVYPCPSHLLHTCIRIQSITPGDVCILSYICHTYPLCMSYAYRTWVSGHPLALLFRSWEGSCPTVISPPFLVGTTYCRDKPVLPTFAFFSFSTQAISVSGHRGHSFSASLSPRCDVTAIPA